MYYILYFYVQPFSVQSSTFIVFYVRVLLHWDPFYIQSFYLQSSTFSLLRSVFLHSIPPSNIVFIFQLYNYFYMKSRAEVTWKKK